MTMQKVDPTKIQITDFRNIGLEQRFVKYQYSREDMDPVWQAIEQVKEDQDNAFDYRKHLVGHIRHEYRLADTVKKSINALMAPLIEQYSRFHALPQTLTLGQVWVNLQNKHEFNPPHTHDGLLSFVMWMKIPYTFAQEDEGNEAKKALSGRFGFIVPEKDECKTVYLDSDSKEENTVVLFPAKLMHMVHPYHSTDEQRITVSANYYDMHVSRYAKNPDPE